MLYGSIITFLVEIKCCNDIKIRSQGRSNDVRLYVTFLVGIKCCKVLLKRFW